MMKNALLRALMAGMFLAITLPLHAQILKESMAPSIEFSLEDPAQIHDYTPAVDWDALGREDEQAKKEGSPMRAGFAVKVGKGINEFGEWLRLPDGRMLWRVTLRAEGASGLGVVFDQFKLPEGSELYLYNEDRSMVNGALGSHNNSEHQVLSTQVLFGSTITIEYVETPMEDPVITANYQSQAVLHVGELMFMYRDVYSIFDGSKPATGASDVCEVDINCAVGANWQNQKRGVVHTLNKIGSSWYYCSGSLVNNTAETFDPYFLTAFHCGEGASAADRLQWQFYFNYERPECGAGTPVTTDVITGCELRAQAPIAGGSDFLLVELNNQVPLSYNPFYNGWERQNIGATSGAGIHHPAGDVKKISTFSATLTSSNPNIGGDIMATNAAWRVVWSANESGWGVTEGGSSGSPLFNQNGLLVGTLTGGSSYCNAQTSPDYYGKFSYHWESNGTSDAERLRPWLDPLGTNPTTQRGWDPQWPDNGVSNPLSFSAAATSPTEISLNWTKNVENHDVMVVWALNNAFGQLVEGTPYSPGETIPGGGTVLYNGSNVSYSHTGLNPATIYYYKAFSVNADSEYSTGLLANATTDCAIISTLPFNMDFSGLSAVPDCWSGENDFVDWSVGTVANGVTGTTPPYAFASYTGKIAGTAYLLSPVFDFSYFSDVTISFKHSFYLPKNSSGSGGLEYSLDGGNSWTSVIILSSSSEAIFNNTLVALAGESNVLFRWFLNAGSSNNIKTYTYSFDDLLITASATPYYVDFNADKTLAYVNEEVLFTDASGSGATGWSWNFGNGASPASATGQGPHTVYYTTIGEKTISLTIDTEAGPFTRTKNNYISITENPFPPPRSLAGAITTYGVGVNLSWLSPLLNEGFESYSDFALAFGNWPQVDLDGSDTYGIENYTFLNQYYTGSFIVFNPSQVSPALTTGWEPYEGQKYAVCFSATTPPNNDWLISPKVMVSEGESFSFRAKSYTSQYGLERFKVGVSTTGTNPADFTIISVGAYVEAPTSWTLFTYDLSAYAGQEVYLAINCVSNDAFALMVDQVMVEDGTKENSIAEGLVSGQEEKDPAFTKIRGNVGPVMSAGSGPKSFASYTVYRNSEPIGTTESFSLYDGPLAPGIYEYVVTANYIDPNHESPHSNLAEVIIDTRGWTGQISTDWVTGSNWLGNAVPGLTENVAVFTAAVDHFPALDGTLAEIAGLTLAPGVSLQIGPLGQLTVNGTLTNLAGAMGLQIASDASGTGSLIHHTEGVDATVQRYVSGGWDSWDDGWHIISAPAASQAIADFIPGSGDYDFYGWHEPSNTWINYKENGTDPIQFSDWNGTFFNPGQGYLISYENTQTMGFAGSLHVSDVAKTGLTQSTGTYSGWHLLGNPFASALKWNDGNWAFTNINSVAKIWHEGNMSYSDIGTEGIIPSAQGFMVWVNDAAGGGLTIPAASRTHSSQDWYKDGGLPKIRLMAREHNNRSAQESNIVVIPETSVSFHPYFDSRFLWGYAPGFYSLKDGEALSTFTIPALDEDLVIPLGFDKNGASQFTITLEEFPEGTTLYLFDKKLGVEHPLAPESPYAFTAEAGDASQRFELRFSPANTTGLEETLAEGLSIYTWDNTLYLAFAEEAGGRLLQVFDLGGRLVMADRLDNGLNHSRPLHLEAGVYLVRVSSPRGVATERVIVK